MNTMTPVFIAKLGLKMRKTSIDAQKINSSVLETYKMALTDFSLQDSLGKI